MKTLIWIALAGGVAACGSPSESDDSPVVESDVACSCGDAETSFHGCAHPLCVSGQGTDNPDCVCGPLSIEE
jgi:hypothetical protein